MKMYTVSPRKQSGLLLIEVMISLLIFSAAILSLVGMQAYASRVSTDAEDRNRASTMASEIIAGMWLQGTLAPSATDLAAWQARLSNVAVSGLPNANGNVSAADVNGVVTVTITWKSPSKKAADPNSQYVTQVAMP